MPTNAVPMGMAIPNVPGNNRRTFNQWNLFSENNRIIISSCTEEHIHGLTIWNSFFGCQCPQCLSFLQNSLRNCGLRILCICTTMQLAEKFQTDTHFWFTPKNATLWLYSFWQWRCMRICFPLFFSGSYADECNSNKHFEKLASFTQMVHHWIFSL